MDLGFKNAFKAGISFGKDDLIIPENKEKIVSEAKKMVEEITKSLDVKLSDKNALVIDV